MKAPIPVSAFDLDTLDRKDFPSMARAAVYCGIDKSMLQKYLYNDQQHNGWYWCMTDQVEKKAERVQYLSRRWKAEGKPRSRKRTGQKILVPLRLDANTVLYVTPEKANPEFAEQYRQKLLKNSRKQ